VIYLAINTEIFGVDNKMNMRRATKRVSLSKYMKHVKMYIGKKDKYTKRLRFKQQLSIKAGSNDCYTFEDVSKRYYALVANREAFEANKRRLY
jgi:hypothetical protein